MVSDIGLLPVQRQAVILAIAFYLKQRLQTL